MEGERRYSREAPERVRQERRPLLGQAARESCSRFCRNWAQFFWILFVLIAIVLIVLNHYNIIFPSSRPKNRTNPLVDLIRESSNHHNVEELDHHHRHHDDCVGRGRGLRWGVAGLGRIAHDFTVALRERSARVCGVAAGSAVPLRLNRSATFATLFGVKRAYDSYEALAADPDIDIVYVSNTNELHYSTSMTMMRGNKSVLVEKPTAMSGSETRDLFTFAATRGVLFSTNYWTRYMPALRRLREELRLGVIGEVYSIRGDLGFDATSLSPRMSERFLSADRGGGVLLDLGGYLVQYATLLAFPPYSPMEVSAATKQLNNGGVEVEASFILQGFNSSARVRDRHQLTASFTLSHQRQSPFTVEIFGSRGSILVEAPAVAPTRYAVTLFEEPSKKKTMLPCCQTPVAEHRIESSPLPGGHWNRYGPAQYLGTRGLVYVVDALARCFSAGSASCFETEELGSAEQMVIADILDKLHSISYSTEEAQNQADAFTSE